MKYAAVHHILGVIKSGDLGRSIYYKLLMSGVK